MSARNFYIYVVPIVIFCLATSCFAEFNNLPYASDRILVKFARTDGKQKTVAERNAVLSARKTGKVKRSLNFVPDVSVVELPKDINVPDALKLLKNDPNFEYAEPDWVLHLGSREPNDQYFINQWGLHNTGQGFHENEQYTSQGTEDADIDGPEAYDVNTTSSITVAVLDTGVDYAHPDLAGNIWTNQNGYHGYDFVNNDNDPCDDHYHGTHVAGIIGAVGNNGIGVSGVAWKVKIMALKIFNSSDIGYSSDAVDAIDYAINNGAKIINASWGWYAGDPYLENIQTLKEAILRADANGVLVITSVGNGNTNIDITLRYPASYDRTECPNLIAVMATDKNDYIASMPNWSNYGPNSIDIAAPGEEIYSTMPHNATAAMAAQNLSAGYDMLDGTSMSAAYVSGACALVWSQMLHEHPNDCNYMDVKNTILNTAEQLPVLAGKCATEGRLNLNYAIKGTIPIPMARITGGDANAIIQDAIDKAVNGNEIVLDKGTYYQDVKIDHKALTIRSIDPNSPSIVANTLICGQTSSNVFDLDRNVGTTLTGLTITHSDDAVGYPAYVYNKSNVTISKCELFSPFYGSCIYSNDSTINIVGCRIHGDRDSTYGVSSYLCDTTVRNCLIYDWSFTGIYTSTAFIPAVRTNFNHSVPA